MRPIIKSIERRKLCTLIVRLKLNCLDLFDVKPDCIKTFDTFESQIMVFGNIFAIKIVLKNNFYLESFIL